MASYYDVTLKNAIPHGTDILNRACAVQVSTSFETHTYQGSVLAWLTQSVVRIVTQDRQLEIAIQAGITKVGTLRINVNGSYLPFGPITTITKV